MTAQHLCFSPGLSLVREGVRKVYRSGGAHLPPPSLSEVVSFCKQFATYFSGANHYKKPIQSIKSSHVFVWLNLIKGGSFCLGVFRTAVNLNWHIGRVVPERCQLPQSCVSWETSQPLPSNPNFLMVRELGFTSHGSREGKRGNIFLQARVTGHVWEPVWEVNKGLCHLSENWVVFGKYPWREKRV